MPPVDTPMERPGKLESHWNSGPWVKATSRPIQIPREALNAASRCQLSSMKPGLGTTTSVRGESHTAGKEATTINNTAKKSEYGARRSIGRLPAVCDGSGERCALPIWGRPLACAAKATLPARRRQRLTTPPRSPSMAQDALSAVSRPSATPLSWRRLPRGYVFPSLHPAYLAAGKSDARKALSCHKAGTRRRLFCRRKRFLSYSKSRGRFSISRALAGFPAHPTREETCKLRARKRHNPPAHLTPNLRETGVPPGVSLRRHSWPPSTSQPVSISRPIASSGSTNSSPCASRDCPISQLSHRK